MDVYYGPIRNMFVQHIWDFAHRQRNALDQFGKGKNTVAHKSKLTYLVTLSVHDIQPKSIAHFI